MQEQGIWPRHAGQWQRVGPPLRPGPDDVRHIEACIAAWSSRQRRAAPRALLLGVTPELATLNWPDGTALLAVDRALPMIHAVGRVTSAGVTPSVPTGGPCRAHPRPGT